MRWAGGVGGGSVWATAGPKRSCRRPRPLSGLAPLYDALLGSDRQATLARVHWLLVSPNEQHHGAPPAAITHPSW